MLNPRLLPLAETLIETGLDWLAVELLEAVNSGRWPEEEAETLAQTRARVRAGELDQQALGKLRAIAPEPIPMDEQIDWAVVYVAERIEAALDDLENGLENLESIIGESARDSDAAQHEAKLHVRVGTEQGAAEISITDVLKARTRMPALREALRRWSVG